MTVITGISGCQVLTNVPVKKAATSDEWLAKAIGDAQAAGRIGQAYLKVYPEERRRDWLIETIDKAIQPYVDGNRPANAERVFLALKQAVQQEYVRGEVSLVEGWVLSRTEVRLYAFLVVK